MTATGWKASGRQSNRRWITPVIHWDTDGDFVLDGKQHNTYDIEFYGPNPLSNIYYLAALRAVEEMAKALGEPDIARRCRQAFEAGTSKFDALLLERRILHPAH